MSVSKIKEFKVEKGDQEGAMQGYEFAQLGDTATYESDIPSLFLIYFNFQTPYL